MTDLHRPASAPTVPSASESSATCRRLLEGASLPYTPELLARLRPAIVAFAESRLLGAPMEETMARCLLEQGVGLVDPDRSRFWIDEVVYGSVCERARLQEARAGDAEALLSQALEIVRGFLTCAEIADCAPEDKEPETVATETKAYAWIGALPSDWDKRIAGTAASSEAREPSDS